jgi:hypothetical protein
MPQTNFKQKLVFKYSMFKYNALDNKVIILGLIKKLTKLKDMVEKMKTNKREYRRLCNV